MAPFSDRGSGTLDMPAPECLSALMEAAVKRHDLDQVLPAGLLL